MIFLELVPHSAMFVLLKKCSEMSGSFFCIVTISGLQCCEVFLVVSYMSKKHILIIYVPFDLQGATPFSEWIFYDKNWTNLQDLGLTAPLPSLRIRLLVRNTLPLEYQLKYYYKERKINWRKNYPSLRQLPSPLLSYLDKIFYNVKLANFPL